MQLPKAARKRSLAALVGPGHQENALPAGQVKVVADYRLLLQTQLVRQCHVVTAAAEDLLLACDHLRVADGEAPAPKDSYVLQHGDIELQLALAAADHCIQIVL